MTPDELRKSSLLGSTAMHRVLAGVYAELVDRQQMDDDEIVEFLGRVAPHMEGPVSEGSIWTTKVPDDVFTVGALAPRSRRQDLKVLRDALVSWATSDSEWLDTLPLAA